MVVRKKLFIQRVVKHRLPREVVDDPSLSVFEARMGSRATRSDAWNPCAWQGVETG